MRRVPLLAGAVLLCYVFEWSALRHFTSEVVLRFAELRGLSPRRLGPDLVFWQGTTFRFGISCTFADVFCGAIPFVWLPGGRVIRNVSRLTVLALALLAFNLFRVCLTSLMFSAGVPWGLADPVISGASYFAVWVCVIRVLRQTLQSQLNGVAGAERNDVRSQLPQSSFQNRRNTSWVRRFSQ